MVTPVGGDQHARFIVKRPTNMTLGQLFPENGPSQKVVNPIYLGGPLSPQGSSRPRPAEAEPGPVGRAGAPLTAARLLVQAFLFVGHPIATSQTRYVVPRDFESAAGFEVVTALG